MSDEKPIAPVLGWDSPPSMEGPPPEPDPDHNRRILKEKRFEILAVVGFIVLGTGFLMWRGVTPTIVTEAPETLGEAIETVQYSGFARNESTDVLDRQVITLERHIGAFDCTVDLFGIDEAGPFETALIWLAPVAEEWPPSEAEYQDAVDAVANTGARLVPTAAEAIQKAIDTSLFDKDADRPHDKGVAATQDGWKITYVVFKSFDEKAEPRPALTLVLQSLGVASDVELEAFNRALYAAVRAGVDVKQALANSSGT